MNIHSSLAQQPRAYGGPFGRAHFRTCPQDFVVDEQIRVPDHEGGAHWWLRLAKTGMNTKDAAHVLTGLGTARIRQVSYAGLKDRHAVTQQWFSLPIETLDPEHAVENLPEGLELLEYHRARHAIRRGGLLGNRFEIRLRNFTGDRQALETALEKVRAGVPNYFGEQRFGHEMQNLARARQLLQGKMPETPRHERGLYLSAARSWLFNLLLAHRVENGSWNQLIEGEAVILDGKRSWFNAGNEVQALAGRLEVGDIHPSGPLPGTDDEAAELTCLELEHSVLAPEQDLIDGLVQLGMRAERRALRLIPQELQHQWEENDLLLAFTLPRGCYATSVLRELLETTPPDPAPPG